jgi:hypothetical protein
LARVLNSARLQILNLSFNKHIHSPSLARFLAQLDFPHLLTLNMNQCELGPEITGPLVEYISSPRSRHLDNLHLVNDSLEQSAVEPVVDHIEKDNYTSLDVRISQQRWPTGIVIIDVRRSACETLWENRIVPLMERNEARGLRT